jgi:flavin reductase (DIM6/NTAB) family NADH-FMN oxidoreductase RutF
METLQLAKAFTLIEPGPVVLVTTHDGEKDNVMTITWTMVIGFSAEFAITTGPWNHSYGALRDTRECVIAIPTVDLIDTVVGIGTCSGRDTDKFEKFGLSPIKAEHVRAPLIKECLANIECRVVDIVDRHSIVVLEGLAAYYDSTRQEKRMIHAVGDGTFVVDGCKLDRKEMMRIGLGAGVTLHLLDINALSAERLKIPLPASTALPYSRWRWSPNSIQPGTSPSAAFPWPSRPMCSRGWCMSPMMIAWIMASDDWWPMA